GDRGAARPQPGPRRLRGGGRPRHRRRAPGRAPRGGAPRALGHGAGEPGGQAVSLLDLPRLKRALSDVDPCVVAGRVTHASGIMVEAALPRVTLGTSCEIRAAGGRQVTAEVVGFTGGRALLMPFGEVSGIGEGCAVVPRASA